MLKDIEKALQRAFADYKVTLKTENESLEDTGMLTTLIACEVVKELAAETAAAKPKRAPRNRNADAEAKGDSKSDLAKITYLETVT